MVIDRPKQLRWYRRPVVILATIGCAIVLSILYGLFGPESAIVVSRETTLITEPRAPDGLPDFANHVLALPGRRIPPEENAAVPLLEALWPMGIAPTELPAVCRGLGIPAPADRAEPPHGMEADGLMSHAAMDGIDALLSIAEAGAYDATAEDPDEDSDEPHEPSRFIIYDVHIAAMEEPWKASEIPPLDDWLNERSRGLDLIVEASRRPRLSFPSPDSPESGTIRQRLDTQLIPLHAIGKNVEGLAMRAMRHLGAGRVAEAWQDIFSMHRLARLAMRFDAGLGAGYVTAIDISKAACLATLRLLESSKIDRAMLAVVQRDLDSLLPAPTRSHAFTIDRCVALDFLLHVFKQSRQQRPQSFQGLATSDRAIPWIAMTSLDWNALLHAAVSHLGRIEAALAERSWAERQMKINELFCELSGPSSTTLGFLDDALQATGAMLSRRARSERIARAFGQFWIHQMTFFDLAVTRDEAFFEGTRIAVALAAFRGGQEDPGEACYPDRLDELVPRFLKSLPLDPFTGDPFVYERRGEGFLLYSLDEYGVDEGGTTSDGSIVRGEWIEESSRERPYRFDIVIRLPMPGHRVLEHLRSLPGSSGSDDGASHGHPRLKPLPWAKSPVQGRQAGLPAGIPNDLMHP